MPLFVAALVAVLLISGARCAYLASARGGPTGARPSGPALLALAAVLALAGLLRIVLVPAHHAMYLDEPWYAEAGCNLARHGQLTLCETTWDGTVCAPYAKAPGWPILIGAWSVLFGCDPGNGIDLNRIAGVLTVGLVALAAVSAGATWWQSAAAATLAAIAPVHVSWSATGETNVAAATLLLAGLCGALCYLRTGRPSAVALAGSAFALASALRPELWLPATTAAAVLYRTTRARPQSGRAAIAIVALSSLSAAAGWQLWQMNTSLSGGAFLSASSLAANAASLLRPEGLRLYGPLAILALLGGLRLARQQRGAAWLLLATAGAAALVVLAYDRFHERMLLAATVALLPLTAFAVPAARASGAAHGVRRGLAAAALLLAALCWHSDLRAAFVPPDTQLLETRITARIADIAQRDEGIFVAAHPTVALAGGAARAMSARVAMHDVARLDAAVAAGTPIYFLCDMYCEAGFESGAADAWCGELFARFAVQPVVEEALHTRTYGVYRLVGPASGAAAPPPCPRR
jgi:hypothetical protein